MRESGNSYRYLRKNLGEMNDHHDHTRPAWWSPSGLAHVATAAKYFWTSPVNDAVVVTIDPQPGERLLDMGAGIGPATVAAAQLVLPGGVVIAVDPSRFMRVVLTVRRSWQRARGAIDVRTGTAEAMPVGDGMIDGAWALNAMHHFDDLQRAAGELRRVLRPGARLLLVDEDFNDSGHRFCGLADDDHGPGFVDPDEMIGHLEDAGFTDAAFEHRVLGGAPAFVIMAHRGPGEGW